MQPVVGGQSSSSFVPNMIKTEVLLDCDDRARKGLLLQQYGERIEKLSQQDRLSKFCIDAGFVTTVEVGQYFMTKDTAEFSQFTDAVACHEYTLPRDEGASVPKGWIGHSGRNLIEPLLQDNVAIPSDFFQYIYHVGCAINLHSIINSGLILGGQNLSNRQTVFFLPIDLRDQEHKDFDTIDLGSTASCTIHP